MMKIVDELDQADLLHRIYVAAKNRLVRSEQELKEAKEECLRAGMEHVFAGTSEPEVSQLRQELALRLWEQACEDVLLAKDRLYDELKREVVRRKFGGIYASDPSG